MDVRRIKEGRKKGGKKGRKKGRIDGWVDGWWMDGRIEYNLQNWLSYALFNITSSTKTHPPTKFHLMGITNV